MKKALILTIISFILCTCSHAQDTTKVPYGSIVKLGWRTLEWTEYFTVYLQGPTYKDTINVHTWYVEFGQPDTCLTLLEMRYPIGPGFVFMTASDSSGESDSSNVYNYFINMEPPTIILFELPEVLR